MKKIIEHILFMQRQICGSCLFTKCYYSNLKKDRVHCECAIATDKAIKKLNKADKPKE